MKPIRILLCCLLLLPFLSQCGRDMNLRQLTEPVEEIVYRTDNADLILQYKDQLLLESEAPTTDFIALYLDSILRELNPRRNRS